MSWGSIFDNFGNSAPDKATCPSCAHSAPVGTIYCRKCGVTMDNAPLNKKTLQDSEKRATEVFFASLGVVLRRNPENAYGCIRGSKSKKDNTPWPDRCKKHQKSANQVLKANGEYCT